MPTIRDVAAAAGVAPITASRALSNKPDVKEETRQQILEVARRLGYRPNQPARALRTQRSALIGVYGPELLWPSHSGVVVGAARKAAVHGYRLLLEPENYHPLRGACDGYLIAHRRDVSLDLDDFYGQSIVFVLHEPHDWAGPFVGIDSIQMVRLALRHSAEFGYRRLGIITIPRAGQGDNPGFHEPLDWDMVPGVNPVVIESNTDSDAMRDSLGLLVAQHVDAIFVPSILATPAALRILKEMDVVVGSDVAFIGAETSNLSGLDLVNPSITALRFPVDTLGSLAVGMLLKLMEGQSLDSDRVLLSPELIVRDSA